MEGRVGLWSSAGSISCPRKKPDGRWRIAEQENTENVHCSLLMCNTRPCSWALSKGTAWLFPRTASSRCVAVKKKDTRWIILIWCLLPASGNQLGQGWNPESFIKATVFICCWSHCPTWIYLMPLEIHFLTATVQLWMVWKSTSFWACLF